jgi:hypothetical protein
MKRYYVVDMSDYVVAVFKSIDKAIDYRTKNYVRGMDIKTSCENVKKGSWLSPSLCQ